MLELTTKWMTNTLAKKSIQSNDFIVCENGNQLFIISYGNITSSGKNTYNYILRDVNGMVIEEGNNAYLDKLTSLVKGVNSKTKESKNEKATSLELEFIALQSKYESAKAKFEDFCTKHEVKTIEDAKCKDDERKKAKRQAHQSNRRSEDAMLKRLQVLRKWSKETKRVELLQKLSDKMLEI